MFTAQRIYLPTETVSSLYVDSVVLCKILELPWRDNHHNISCIPEDTYDVIKEAYTEKHPYPHFRILNVPNRSGILIHRITYVKDLRGCLGAGEAFVDLNKDGVPDIVRSSIALQELYDFMPEAFKLTIMRRARPTIV